MRYTTTSTALKAVIDGVRGIVWDAVYSCSGNNNVVVGEVWSQVWGQVWGSTSDVENAEKRYLIGEIYES